MQRFNTCPELEKPSRTIKVLQWYSKLLALRYCKNICALKLCSNFVIAYTVFFFDKFLDDYSKAEDISMQI